MCRFRTIASLSLVFVLWACGGQETKAPGPADDLPPLTGLKEDPARRAGPLLEGEIRLGPNEEVALRALLVAYKGVHRPARRMSLSRSQARRRAEHLLALLRAEGQDFAELCKRYSDDAKTAPKGGRLGVIMPGELHPALERHGFSLKPGQISEPVETPFGFYLLQRVEPDEIQAAEIVVSYTGAKRYTPREARDRQTAEALAARLHQQLLQGADFASLAQAHSDLATHERGGFLPIFGRGMAHPKFEEIVWSLPVGGLSEVIETPTGFHIVRRLPVRRVQIRFIEIMLEGEGEARKRSPAEARALIRELWREAARPGADFAELAYKRSESSNRLSGGGGLMDPFGRGQVAYPLERAAFALKPGQLSEPVDLGHSFVVLKRVR